MFRRVSIQPKCTVITTLQRRLVLSFGLILGVTGAAKIWSSFGVSRILWQPDPVVGIEFRHLMLTVGALELAIACACVFSKSRMLPTILVTWLATSFLLYRLGLWWMGWHRPCPCLGNLTDALHVSPQVADNVMKGVLAYMLIACHGILLSQWIGKMNTVDSKIGVGC